MKMQKTKLRHRVLALALALMLCVSMLNLTAFANDVKDPEPGTGTVEIVSTGTESTIEGTADTTDATDTADTENDEDAEVDQNSDNTDTKVDGDTEVDQNSGNTDTKNNENPEPDPNPDPSEEDCPHIALWAEYNVISATCTEPNQLQQKCNSCGAWVTIPSDWPAYKQAVQAGRFTPREALGHQWTEWSETKPATTEEPGEETHKCERCSLVETREIQKLDDPFTEIPVTLRLNFIGLESNSEIPLSSLSLTYRFSNPNFPEYEVSGTVYGNNAVQTTPNGSPQYSCYKWELSNIRMPKQGTVMEITSAGGSVDGYFHAFWSDNGGAQVRAQQNAGETTCSIGLRDASPNQGYNCDFFYAYQVPVLPYEAYHFYYDRLEGGQPTDYLNIVYAVGSNEHPQYCPPVAEGQEASVAAKTWRYTQIPAGNFIVVHEPTDWTVRNGSQRFDIFYVRAITVTWLDADGEQIGDQKTIAKGQDYSKLYPDAVDETGTWGDPVVDSNGNITIQWQLKTVNVTWADEDGKELYTRPGVKLDEIPAADQYTVLSGKQNPTKAEDANYTYAFSGWTEGVTDSDGNVTYTAQYTSTQKPVSPPVVTTRNLTVNKVWAGDEDAGVRPDSIQVQLYQSGAAYGSPVTLSAANGWSHTWIGLSTVGTLTVEELNIPEGYTAATSVSGSTVTITNTYTDEEIEDPDVPMGTPKPTPTPTPAPSEKPTPDPSATPDPDEEIPDPEVPMGTPKPEPTPGPDEEIPDENVPLGTPKPVKPSEPDNGEEIPDEKVPLANTPKTGDDTGVWMTLALISAAGLVFLGISRKRKGENLR